MEELVKTLLEIIRTRRSIRRYKKSKVELEKILIALEGARWAPSAGNLQNWYYVVITDYDKILEIGKVCYSKFVAEAPIVIVVVSDTKKVEMYYHEMGLKFAHQSIGASIQNLLLMLHVQGLGACWVGVFDENALKRILDIPDDLEIVAVIPVGYPDELPKRDRKSLKNMVFFNKWGKKEIEKDSDIINLLRENIYKEFKRIVKK